MKCCEKLPCCKYCVFCGCKIFNKIRKPLMMIGFVLSVITLILQIISALAISEKSDVVKSLHWARLEGKVIGKEINFSSHAGLMSTYDEIC